MKILIIVQGTKHPHSLLVNSFTKATWMQTKIEDVEIYSFYGCYGYDGLPLDQYETIPEYGEIKLEGNDIIYGGKDYIKGFPHDKSLPWRTKTFYPDVDPRNERFINTLQYCYENFEFDFIYRTSDSYYVDVRELKNHIETRLPSHTSIYTGNVFTPLITETYTLHRNFVAGSNLLMSKDIVKTLVSNKDRYLELSRTYCEDEAAGVLLVDELQYITKLEDQKNWCTICVFQEEYPIEKIQLQDKASIYKVFNWQNTNEINRIVKIHDLITQKYLK